jgi:hypothetical protein
LKPKKASHYRELNSLTEEKLEFTKSFLINGNLALLAWVFLAFFATWFYNQIYGWLLLVLTTALIYLILRRLGCSSCYYCKSCTSGFGRLVGVYFGRGYTKKGSIGNRIGLVAFIYSLLAPLPTIFLSLSMFHNPTLLKVSILTCLIAISTYSLTTWVRNKKPYTKNS